MQDNLERMIATRIVTDAAANGWSMTLRHMEEPGTIVARSNDAAVILAAMGQTDADVIHVQHHATGTRMGWVLLVWGNGPDLISDASGNEVTERWLEGATLLADRLANVEEAEGRA